VLLPVALLILALALAPQVLKTSRPVSKYVFYVFYVLYTTDTCHVVVLHLLVCVVSTQLFRPSIAHSKTMSYGGGGGKPCAIWKSSLCFRDRLFVSAINRAHGVSSTLGEIIIFTYPSFELILLARSAAIILNRL